MATDKRDYIQRTLAENWRREMEAAELYAEAAAREPDGRRKEILGKLAQLELKHARMWEAKLSDLQYDVSTLQRPQVTLGNVALPDLVKRIEDIEDGNAAWYRSLRNVLTEPEYLHVIDEIDRDEAAHGDIDKLLHPPAHVEKRLHPPTHVEKRLHKIWGGESHRQGSQDWVGDAIYGVNDGLGAIFGIISGVAGYTQNTHTVLLSGFFGALASTLSMGAGAWLATKSENEVMETTLAQERREIAEDPEHELEELSLLYQLKGFGPDESQRIAAQIAQDPDQFLKTMVQEEFGFHEHSKGNPWRSAFFGGLSTFVGGVIPLLPFFFLSGWPAMLVAAIISLLAHFLVGAAKSLITVRSWWASGLEMTAVGVIVGVVSYALGWVASSLFGASI